MRSIALSRERPSVIAERISAKAVKLKDTATADERDLVASLVSRAREIVNPINRVFERHIFTPGVCALIWLDHNKYNREWDAKQSAEYAELMLADQWKTTAQSVYAFYGAEGSGNFADGAHRLAAQIWAEINLDMFVCLGMSPKDIAALDCGKKRNAADTARLLGVSRATEKSDVMTGLWGYMQHIGVVTDAVSGADVNGLAQRIKEHDAELSRALSVGHSASHEAEQPLIKDKPAAKIAMILLHCGWDEDEVGELLVQLQNEEFATDASPLMYAHEHISSHRKPANVVTQAHETALIIKAMMMTVDGVEMTSARRKAKIRELLSAMKEWPDPRRGDVPPADPDPDDDPDPENEETGFGDAAEE